MKKTLIALFLTSILPGIAFGNATQAIVIEVVNNQKCTTVYACNGPIRLTKIDKYGKRIYGCQEKRNRRRRRVWSQHDLKITTECVSLEEEQEKK